MTVIKKMMDVGRKWRRGKSMLLVAMCVFIAVTENSLEDSQIIQKRSWQDGLVVLRDLSPSLTT